MHLAEYSCEELTRILEFSQHENLDLGNPSRKGYGGGPARGTPVLRNLVVEGIGRAPQAPALIRILEEQIHVLVDVGRQKVEPMMNRVCLCPEPRSVGVECTKAIGIPPPEKGHREPRGSLLDSRPLSLLLLEDLNPRRNARIPVRPRRTGSPRLRLRPSCGRRVPASKGYRVRARLPGRRR